MSGETKEKGWGIPEGFGCRSGRPAPIDPCDDIAKGVASTEPAPESKPQAARYLGFDEQESAILRVVQKGIDRGLLRVR